MFLQCNEEVVWFVLESGRGERAASGRSAQPGRKWEKIQKPYVQEYIFVCFSDRCLRPPLLLLRGYPRCPSADTKGAIVLNVLYQQGLSFRAAGRSEG